MAKKAKCPPEIACTLLKAAKVIDDRGWCRNQLQDPQGHVCMLGAVGVAANGDPSGAAYGAGFAAASALRVIAEQRYGAHYSVPRLNDDTFKTKKQAVGFLRRAAKIITEDADNA